MAAKRSDKPQSKKPPAQAPASGGKAPAEGRKSKVQEWIDGAVGFLKSVRAEAKRVTWPSRQELRQSTMVVLVVLVIVTLYLWTWDTLFTWIFNMLRKI